jgi:hypothetical protein
VIAQTADMVQVLEDWEAVQPCGVKAGSETIDAILASGG